MDLWDAVQKKLIENTEGRGQKRVSHGSLLQGILYSEAGVLYTPVFTSKKSQLYRYYVSRNKFEGKKSPARRYPAQEIEDFVVQTLREYVEDLEKLSRIVGVDHALNYDMLQDVSREYAAFSAETLVKKVVRGVTIGKDSLVIGTNPDGYKITAPFQMGGDKTCAIVIRPPATHTPEDIFSLPPHRLKNLVKGIIWRDEHFRGMSIRGIARRERCDDTLVGRLIRESLEIA